MNHSKQEIIYKLLTFLLVLFFFDEANAQSKKYLKELPPPPPSLNCVYHGKFSATKRLQNYPFNITKTIEIVSFDNSTRDSSAVQPDGSISIYPAQASKLPLQNDTVALSQLKERIQLNKLKINQLTNIFYNFSFPKGFSSNVSHGCYSPRNAILFFDSQNQVFAYVEICFECEEFRTSNKKIQLGELCEDKFELLRKFFKTNGITIGVKE